MRSRFIYYSQYGKQENREMNERKITITVDHLMISILVTLMNNTKRNKTKYGLKMFDPAELQTANVSEPTSSQSIG